MLRRESTHRSKPGARSSVRLLVGGEDALRLAVAEADQPAGLPLQVLLVVGEHGQGWPLRCVVVRVESSLEMRRSVGELDRQAFSAIAG